MIWAGLLTLILALLGAPLFVVIGASALLAMHGAELDSSLVGIELYRLARMPLLVAIPLAFLVMAVRFVGAAVSDFRDCLGREP